MVALLFEVTMLHAQDCEYFYFCLDDDTEMFMDLDVDMMEDDLASFENTLYVALPEVSFV